MLEKVRSWLGDVADLYTLATAALGATVVSIIGQAIVDGYLGLSLFEQIILTVSSFSLVLILLFGLVRTALNRRHSRRHEIERLSGELQQTQSAHELEREQLNGKLQEIEKTLEAQLTTQRMPSVGGTASYPLLKDSELQDTSFGNRTIYIADFANEVRNRKFSTVVVSNLVFKNCCIVGPAVLVAINTGQIGGKRSTTTANGRGEYRHSGRVMNV